jgi:hypothetical protein
MVDHVAWLEGWSYEFALMSMEMVFAAEEAIAANHGTKADMDRASLVKIVGSFNENTMNVFWFVKEDGREWPQMHTANIAGVSHTLKQSQAILIEVW